MPWAGLENPPIWEFFKIQDSQGSPKCLGCCPWFPPWFGEFCKSWPWDRARILCAANPWVFPKSHSGNPSPSLANSFSRLLNPIRLPAQHWQNGGTNPQRPFSTFPGLLPARNQTVARSTEHPTDATAPWRHWRAEESARGPRHCSSQLQSYRDPQHPGIPGNSLTAPGICISRRCRIQQKPSALLTTGDLRGNDAPGDPG
jgi:hypothetical protein